MKNKRFRPNMETVASLMGHWAVRDVSRWDRGQIGTLISSGRGFLQTYAHDLATGSVYGGKAPLAFGNSQVVVQAYFEDYGASSPLAYDLAFPVDWLVAPLRKYTLYHVRFAMHKAADTIPSLHPFLRGYYGITGRDPRLRVREHFRDTISGGGHLLHNSWRYVRDAWPDMCGAIVTLVGQADTLDAIYDMEEEAVAKHTLSPRGLNMIPGGRAGLREMGRLGLISRQNVSPDERDCALVDLEQGRGPVSVHYRRGHMRTLPTGRTKATTWVSPCIVGLNASAAA